MGSHNFGVMLSYCLVMSDRVLPLLVVYVLFTDVTPGCFYLWMVFPPIGHAAILH